MKNTNEPGLEEILAINTGENPTAPADAQLHIYGKQNCVCLTDSRGYATPKNRNRAELVLDVSEGFIPLWEKETHLRWRFSPALERYFQNPAAAKQYIRNLMGTALLAWGDAAPVKFAEREDAWDFEIVMRPDQCNANGGCVLASAFFPDSGRHELAIHPKMFTQTKQEQAETLMHEIGHIFGLRHFFAEVSESAWPSVKFGEHRPFSIMNYGVQSVLTPQDKTDLKKLYQKVWSGELTHINGTRIVQFKPYHTFGVL